jgi:hypothetical protein
VLPGLVEVERAAAQAAADAQSKAHTLEEIVGKARTDDSPSAWTEALRLVSAAGVPEDGRS